MRSKTRTRTLGLVIVAWLIGGNAAWAERPTEQAPHAFPEYSRTYTENALAPIVQPGRDQNETRSRR